jgi:3-phosphoshikimate 1-carboxyvinyltransferase
MIQAWESLGVPMNWDRGSQSITVDGCGGQVPRTSADLFVANSGTSLRFLTAALATCHGDFLIDGVPRMRQRPVADLLDGLTQLGAQVASLNLEHPGCPPVQIQADGLRGGSALIAGSVSSQFLSGLLMAAPYARETVEIRVVGELVSRPYVAMTLAVMRSFGVDVDRGAQDQFVIQAPRHYMATRYEIEPDASAASYFLAAAAITGGCVRVLGLHRHALQGDVGFCHVLESMGCQVQWDPDGIQVQATGSLHGVDVDMNAISDTVQTLAAVAIFASSPTRIRGVAHNRFKETDRIGDLARELRRLGARVDEHEDGLTIHPSPSLQAADIETYNDHRMAMSLALVGLRVPGVRVLNPGCTEKTYPHYFDDMRRLISSEG